MNMILLKLKKAGNIFLYLKAFIPKTSEKVEKKPTQRSGLKRKREELQVQTTTNDLPDQENQYQLRRSSRLRKQVN